MDLPWRVGTTLPHAPGANENWCPASGFPSRPGLATLRLTQAMKTVPQTPPRADRGSLHVQHSTTDGLRTAREPGVAQPTRCRVQLSINGVYRRPPGRRTGWKAGGTGSGSQRAIPESLSPPMNRERRHPCRRSCSGSWPVSSSGRNRWLAMNRRAGSDNVALRMRHGPDRSTVPTRAGFGVQASRARSRSPECLIAATSSPQLGT